MPYTSLSLSILYGALVSPQRQEEVQYTIYPTSVRESEMEISHPQTALTSLRESFIYLG